MEQVCVCVCMCMYRVNRGVCICGFSTPAPPYMYPVADSRVVDKGVLYIDDIEEEEMDQVTGK